MESNTSKLIREAMSIIREALKGWEPAIRLILIIACIALVYKYVII
jgi:hypothetical protein